MNRLIGRCFIRPLAVRQTDNSTQMTQSLIKVKLKSEKISNVDAGN